MFVIQETPQVLGSSSSSEDSSFIGSGSTELRELKVKASQAESYADTSDFSGLVRNAKVKLFSDN